MRVCVRCGRIREAQGILGLPVGNPTIWTCKVPCDEIRDWRRLEGKTSHSEELHGKRELALALALARDALEQLATMKGVLPAVLGRLELATTLLARAELLVDVPRERLFAFDRIELRADLKEPRQHPPLSQVVPPEAGGARRAAGWPMRRLR